MGNMVFENQVNKIVSRPLTKYLRENGGVHGRSDRTADSADVSNSEVV
jgi:hypothetical protein